MSLAKHLLISLAVTAVGVAVIWRIPQLKSIVTGSAT